MDNIEEAIKKINILIVDDMEAIRSMINSCLKHLGVEHVFMDVNGEVAWKTLNEKRVDLVICDWDMPKVSGLELLKRIRASEHYNHIPFLMLTATTKREHIVDAINAGTSDYLTKPFKPKELEYRVIKLLRKVKSL